MDISMDILFFGIAFLFVFLIDYFFILRRSLKYIKGEKKSKKKKTTILEVRYLQAKYGLNKDNLYKTSIMLWIAFLNAIIISLVTTLISMINTKFIIQLLIGFVLLFVLIYAVYEIFGRALKRKGY